MLKSVLDQPCGRYLQFRALIEAGETWKRTRIPNFPQQPETWAALRQLAETILDPVIDRFGAIHVTYGFASLELTRYVLGRIDPSRDQHAGYELRPNGKPICPRLGQAVDFLVPDTSSATVASWLAETQPFDRIYYYGSNRPLHVSIGPEMKRFIVAMLPGPSGRRIPRVRPLHWLLEQA